MTESVLEMAKELVMAQIESGQLLPGDMNDALQKTYASLMELKSQEETGVASPVGTPAHVDWRKSITRRSITCLECGQSFKQLSIRHLRQHNLDGASYRTKYRIPRTQPLAARATTARRREVAQEIKPWMNTPRYIQSQAAKANVAKQETRKKAART